MSYEMKVQTHLRNGGTLADLTARYGIACKQSVLRPELYLLKYDQIESPMGEPVVQECRGVILNSQDNWEVVSRPFDKFFNMGEGHAKPIDWTTARVQEKMDGSLMVLFWYAGEWRVSTSGNPDAAGEVGTNGFTFRQLFWETFKKSEMSLPFDIEDELCVENFVFIFELTSKYNRIVVVQDEPVLTLIGVRRTYDGREFSTDLERWSLYGFTPVKSYPLQTADDILDSFKKLNPLKTEGYVVVDANYNRVKVKHPGYVALHHLKEGMGPRRILEVVRSGETTEVATYFPEWADLIKEITVEYEALVTELTAQYEVIRDIPVQKDFALLAQKTRHPGVCFALRSGKIASIRQGLSEIAVDKLEMIIR